MKILIGDNAMNRREFISASGATLLGTAVGAGRVLGAPARLETGLRIAWHREEISGLFDRVEVAGQPLTNPENPVGLFEGSAQWLEDGRLGAETTLTGGQPKGKCGPVQLSLTHVLHRSAGGSTEDLLEATLTLRNDSHQACELRTGFLTGVRPGGSPTGQQVYVPLSASGLRDAEDDNRRRLKDCRQAVGTEGFLCHYLEPQASDPRATATRAALLAPVVDLFAERHRTDAEAPRRGPLVRPGQGAVRQ